MLATLIAITLPGGTMTLMQMESVLQHGLANNDLTLLDPKSYPTFHLGSWKFETNANLSFLRTETTSQLPNEKVIEKFSW